MVDVRQAAALVGRHPETIRRWVWSGRLAARHEGNRVLVARADLEALRGHADTLTLVAWAELARAARGATHGPGVTAADLVIEDRAQRSEAGIARAGR